jgi:hypothetical protein
VTPFRQELGHFMWRDRRRMHELFPIAYHPQKFSARGSFSKKTSIQMITLIARSCLWE